MTLPGFFNPNFVKPSFRRSRHLKDQYDQFIKGEYAPEHFSPSGQTAILFAERALAEGLAVTLKIHPRYGMILSLGGGPLERVSKGRKNVE